MIRRLGSGSIAGAAALAAIVVSACSADGRDCTLVSHCTMPSQREFGAIVELGSEPPPITLTACRNDACSEAELAPAHGQVAHAETSGAVPFQCTVWQGSTVGPKWMLELALWDTRFSTGDLLHLRAASGDAVFYEYRARAFVHAETKVSGPCEETCVWTTFASE